MTELHLPEEVYHTWHWTPIWQEDGTVGGVWNSTLETTQKVIAERRLSGMSELFARMSDARTQDEFGERALEVLSRNPLDLPFVAMYWCEVEDAVPATPTKQQGPTLAGTYLRHHTSLINVKLTLAGSIGIPNGHPIARPTVKYTLDPVTYQPVQVVPEPEYLDSPATSDATPRIPILGSPLGSTASTMQLPPTSPIKGLEEGIDLARVFASGGMEVIDPLPSQLAQGLDGRGFKDVPRAAALLPINTPYDADYASWLESVGASLSSQLTVVLQREADRKLIEEQERIDKAKTMFFTNVSHELRTPLTLIQAPLEQLASSDGLNRDIQYRIQLAMRNCKRLKKLVDSIMDMSKLEAGKLVGNFHPVQLGRVTEDLAALFRSMAEKKGIDYLVSCDIDNEPIVYVDTDLWEKIVFNLLSNAFKYTLEGRIGISVTHDATSSYVRVSDTGVGIPKQHLGEVFERFFRVNNSASESKTAEGTGVGLSLTKELVSFHGGHMSLSSQTEEEAPGQSGSIFTVAIPHGHAHLPTAFIHELPPPVNGTSHREMEYWMELDQPTPSSNASTSDEGESATSSTLFFEKDDVVMVVDDNADMRAFIRKIFTPYLTVVEAKSGADALEIAASQKVNLVLCDVMMPGMNGPELLRRLREERKTKVLPVIFVTASDDISLLDGQADGIVDCINKPFRVRDMLARVHLQLQIGKRRVRLEEDFEVRSHELQVLTDLSPVGIFRADANGKQVLMFCSSLINTHTTLRLMYINPAWHQFTGFPSERDRDEWIDHVHPSSKEQMIRIWRACFEREQSSSMRIQWRTGCWTHVAISPLVSADGALLGAFGAITDINEQHRAEEARIALAEEREHVAASRAEDAEAQRQLEVERRRAQEFDIKQETTQILMVFRNELMSKDIEFHLDLGHGTDVYGLRSISTDRSRYAQIITNLMSNAIRFTDMSTGLREIKVSLQLSLDPPLDESCTPPPLHSGRPLLNSSSDLESGGVPIYIYVSVKDSGPGLHKEDLALLFQRFQQGSNNRPLHVLITEDNKINQTVLARQMKRAGFTYALASNGLEAIQAIDKVDSQVEIPDDQGFQKFDVVLMDLEMPVLDGFAATREIRRREATGNLKTRSFVIALTGNARLEQVQSARDAGVDDVMIKPYQIDKLISKMRAGYQVETDTD
ncbi:multi-sensor signal transduction histidine kinase, putative, partial [Rhizoctonia solani AG-3 Rhs1AP]